MNLDWLLNPVTQYILVGLGLIGSLVLWVSFMKELHSLRANTAQSSKSVDATVRDLSETIEQMKEQIKQKPHNELAPVLAAPAAGSSTKRAQALLLHLSGEPEENISAALGTPKNEIELMLKLSRLLQGSNS